MNDFKKPKQAGSISSGNVHNHEITIRNFPTTGQNQVIVHKVEEKKSSESFTKCCSRCSICFFCVVIIVSFLLNMHGDHLLGIAHDMNPSIDFIYLGEACKIIQVSHSEYDRTETRTESYSCGNSTCTRQVTTTICMDKYVYSFLVDEAVRIEYVNQGLDHLLHTEWEEFERAKRSCYETSEAPVQASFSVNTTQNCWFASRGREMLPEGYHCQNPLCMKILSDPAVEAANALTFGQRVHAAGKYLQYIGYTFLFFSTAATLRSKMTERNNTNVIPQ